MHRRRCARYRRRGARARTAAAADRERLAPPRRRCPFALPTSVTTASSSTASPNALEHCRHRAERHRDHDHVGAGRRARGIHVEAIDHAEVDRAPQVRGLTARPDDLADLAEPLQIAGERSPDEAGAHDAEPVDHRTRSRNEPSFPAALSPGPHRHRRWDRRPGLRLRAPYERREPRFVPMRRDVDDDRRCRPSTGVERTRRFEFLHHDSIALHPLRRDGERRPVVAGRRHRLAPNPTNRSPLLAYHSPHSESPRSREVAIDRRCKASHRENSITT